MGDRNFSDRDNQGRWLPGVSGHNTYSILGQEIRALTGGGRALAEFLMHMLQGRAFVVPDEVVLPSGEVREIEMIDSKTMQPAGIRLERPSMADRRWAFEHLAERGFGKVPEKVELTGRDGSAFLDAKTLPPEVLLAYDAAVTAALAATEAAKTIEGGSASPGLPALPSGSVAGR